jgi:hypothetical protein
MYECPGCGDWGFRWPEQLCGDCKDKLAFANKEMALRRDFIAEQTARTDRRRYAASKLRSYNSHKGIHDPLRHDSAPIHALNGAWLSLLCALDGPSPAPNEEHGVNQSWNTFNPYIAPNIFTQEEQPFTGPERHEWGIVPVVAEAMRSLDNAIRLAIHDAYVNGLHDGSSLLGQLAAGTMTTDVFNSKTTEKKVSDE